MAKCERGSTDETFSNGDLFQQKYESELPISLKRKLYNRAFELKNNSFRLCSILSEFVILEIDF